jgi:hypothetical protein
MMPGVAAQPLGGRSVFSPTVLADADYINGIYELAGSSVAAAAIIDKPGRIGGSGLEILDNDVDGIVSPIGAYLSLWLTLNWTVRIEWQELTTDGATYLVWMTEPVDGHSFLIERSTAFTGLRVDAHEGSFNTRNVEIDTSHGPGVHVIVVTRTNDLLSISCDGSDVVTQVVAPISMNAMETASFGGDPTDQSYNGTFIRKVTLYAPLDDIWLPSLSV